MTGYGVMYMNGNIVLVINWPLVFVILIVSILLIVLIFKKEITDIFKKQTYSAVPDEEHRSDTTNNSVVASLQKHDVQIDNESTDIFDYEVLAVVCKNINSGNNFIVVDELGDDFATMIIPDGKIKDLSLKFFGDVYETNITKLYLDGKLTEAQMKSFAIYSEGETERTIKEIRAVRVLGLPEINRPDEPPYIKSYRSMLKNPDSFPSRMLTVVTEKSSVNCNELKEIMRNRYGYKSDTSGSFPASLRVLFVDGFVDMSGYGDDKVIFLKN